MSLASAVGRIVAPSGDMRITAYDGSHFGDPESPIGVEIRRPEAFNYLVTSPGELGMARAYITGCVDVFGDHYEVLRRLSKAQIATLSWRERYDVLRTLGLRVLRPLPAPPQEVRRLPGLRRHSLDRDAAAISHHYDVSNRFYEMLLGPSMAYTCAVYPTADATLEQAQYAKFDLVARKLDLQPGQRLLDVGCGWGGMVMHAAQHYGVRALGVTLSRQQAEWAQKAIADAGLAELAEVRHLDYRKVDETGFDAVSSIGLTEHIGRRNLPEYFSFLYSKLRPEGRLLNHCITYASVDAAPMVPRGFINRYVFPDGELSAIGLLVTEMQRAGFEVRHEENLREHYAKTLTAWSSNLTTHWDEAVAEIGLATARIWSLYLAGSRLGFESDHIELHQVLGTKTVDGKSGMPLRPTWGA